MKAKDTLFHINWGDGDDFYITAPDRATAIERMPDGKDMVNYVVELKHLYQIIYKAGMEEEAKGGHNAISYLEGLQEGIRKVLRWENEHDVIGFVYDTSDPEVERQNMIDYAKQLKDWGI